MGGQPRVRVSGDAVGGREFHCAGSQMGSLPLTIPNLKPRTCWPAAHPARRTPSVRRTLAHWNPPGATPIRADCTVCNRKKQVRDAAHQCLPERSRDSVDGCSIAPDIFLDSGTPAAPPRATPTALGHLSRLPKCSAVGYHVRRTRPENVPKIDFSDMISGRVRGLREMLPSKVDLR